MAPPNIVTSLATEQDAHRLASVMTAAFSHSDAAYPLIWGAAPEGTHDNVAIGGLFSPVQKPDRITYKAEDDKGRLVGFATWNLPKEKVSAGKGGSGLPDLPGVNMELWNAKTQPLMGFYERDVEPTKDMLLSFLFVDPRYQRQGIGSLLLGWGREKADELVARVFVSSTPQALRTYEKGGWKVVDSHSISLDKYGGQGVYTRSWMVREPAGRP